MWRSFYFVHHAKAWIDLWIISTSKQQSCVGKWTCGVIICGVRYCKCILLNLLMQTNHHLFSIITYLLTRNRVENVTYWVIQITTQHIFNLRLYVVNTARRMKNIVGDHTHTSRIHIHIVNVYWHDCVYGWTVDTKPKTTAHTYALMTDVIKENKLNQYCVQCISMKQFLKPTEYHWCWSFHFKKML